MPDAKAQRSRRRGRSGAGRPGLGPPGMAGQGDPARSCVPSSRRPVPVRLGHSRPALGSRRPDPTPARRAAALGAGNKGFRARPSAGRGDEGRGARRRGRGRGGAAAAAPPRAPPRPRPALRPGLTEPRRPLVCSWGLGVRPSGAPQTYLGLVGPRGAGQGAGSAPRQTPPSRAEGRPWRWGRAGSPTCTLQEPRRTRNSRTARRVPELLGEAPFGARRARQACPRRDLEASGGNSLRSQRGTSPGLPGWALPPTRGGPRDPAPPDAFPAPVSAAERRVTPRPEPLGLPKPPSAALLGQPRFGLPVQGAPPGNTAPSASGQEDSSRPQGGLASSPRLVQILSPGPHTRSAVCSPAPGPSLLEGPSGCFRARLSSWGLSVPALLNPGTPLVPGVF